jgi:hypothetical protein
MRRFPVLLGGLTVGLSLALAAVPSWGGDRKKEGVGYPAVQRGPEHKLMEKLTGTFEAKVKLFLGPQKRAVETTGVMTRTMILHGNFLQESFKGTFAGQSFQGLGLMGYDAAKKKYVTAWCDSMSPTMSYFHGSYDAATKTFTSVGEDLDPKTGKKMKARDVLKIVSENEQYFEMFRQPEGEAGESKMMEITYTRKKAAPKETK